MFRYKKETQPFSRIAYKQCNLEYKEALIYTRVNIKPVFLKVF